MASTERLLDHYEAQATACEQASADLKRAWKLRDQQPQLATETARSLGLATRAWRAAARALVSTEPDAEPQHQESIEKAVKYHRLSLDRLTELGLPVPEIENYPQAEPDIVPATDIDPAAVELAHSLVINNPDSGRPDLILSAGTLDGRHFVVNESTGETDRPSMDAEEHPSLESAWAEILNQASLSELGLLDYEPKLGALSLSWGQQGAAVVPFGARWRLWVRTWRHAEMAEYKDKQEATLAACAAVDLIANAMEASGDRVAELGALWLRRCASQERATLYTRRFYTRLQAAKDDRIVDRYGSVSNQQIAEFAGISVPAINKALAELDARK